MNWVYELAWFAWMNERIIYEVNWMSDQFAAMKERQQIQLIGIKRKIIQQSIQSATSINQNKLKLNLTEDIQSICWSLID